MGFARRVVRKSIRKATPRTVRRAMHPVRTTRNAITPRPIKRMSRAVYTVTNPLGAAENALIGAVLYPGGGRRRRTSSRSSGGGGRSSGSSGGVLVGSGIRAQQALESVDLLAKVMAVQRERFAPASCPVVADPAPPDQLLMQRTAWAALGKSRPRPWKRTQRRETRARLAAQVAQAAEQQHRAALTEVARQRSQVRAWWGALQDGEPETVQAALVAAFADNVAPVSVMWARADQAGLLLLVPEIEVLGAKQAHVTAAGRLSSRNWPVFDLHEAYAGLLGAHLLATAREAWAVGPSLRSLNIVGLRQAGAAGAADRFGRYEVLFDVDLSRFEGQWGSDSYGEDVLGDPSQGLHRTGKNLRVAPWAAKSLRPQTVDNLRQVFNGATS